MRLFSATDYLDYWQTKENTLFVKSNVFVTQAFAFSFNKNEREINSESDVFIEKRTIESKMGIQTIQDNAVFI